MTAKFAADFSDFQTAVANANVALTSMEAGGAKVEAQINRMANSLEGGKIVQQATIAAAAVESIGGVSKLTEAELARVGATATEAAAKLKAMGQEVPQGIQAIADASKNAAKGSDEMGQSWVARIAEGLLLRDAIRELLAQAKELIIGIPEEARALNILSLQTQINVQDLQVLAAATREYGVDADQLGRAVFQLGKRIAGGDESVATAYHLMGMSLDEVRDKQGVELFLATERGLGTLHGTIRDTAAADLYGGRLGVSMGAFSTGVDEAMEKAKRLNTIASEDSVKAAAAYAEAVDRATHSLHAWVMEVEGGAAAGFNTIVDAAAKGASKWDIFNAIIADGATSILTLGTHTSHLADVIDAANRGTAKDIELTKQSTDGHTAAAKALDAHGQAAQFMAALELDAGKPVLAWQDSYLQHLRDIGELNAKNAAGIGVSADQLKNWTKQLEESERVTEETIKATEEYQKILDQMSKETFTLAMEHEKQWRDEQAKGTQRANAAILAEFEAQTKLNAAYGLDAAGAIKVQNAALDTLTEKLSALHARRVEGFSQEKEEQVLMKEYTDALLREAQNQDAVTTSTEKATAATEKATAAAREYIGTIKGSPIGTDQQQIDQGYSGLTGYRTSGEIARGYFPDAATIQQRANHGLQARADGGPVASGQSVLVGERGPEIFTPSSSGTVLPNGGGSQVFHITVTQPFGTPQAIAEAVGAALMQQARGQGVRF